jgi:hypothetical protein
VAAQREVPSTAQLDVDAGVSRSEEEGPEARRSDTGEIGSGKADETALRKGIEIEIEDEE